MLEEGPALGVLSVSRPLGQSRALVPTPMERPIVHGVSKTPRQFSLYMFAFGAHT